MKKFAKVMAVVLCLVLCFALAACGNKNTSVEGTTWSLNSVTDAQGTKVTGEEMASVFGNTVYEFKANGVWAVTAAEQALEGTWSQDGTTVTMTDPNGTTSSGTVSGDELKIESAAGVCVFKKN